MSLNKAANLFWLYQGLREPTFKILAFSWCVIMCSYFPKIVALIIQRWSFEAVEQSKRREGNLFNFGLIR